MLDEKLSDRQEVAGKVETFRKFEKETKTIKVEVVSPSFRAGEEEEKGNTWQNYAPKSAGDRFREKISVYSVSRDDGSGGNRGLSSRAEIGWRTVLKGSNDVTMTSVRVESTSR